jgi:hypothetical protein
MKKCILTALVGLSLSGAALADKPEEIARDLSFVTVPAVQAIYATQKLFPGQVYDVDLESNFVGYYWQVKVLTTDQRLIEAYVDGKTGEVVAADETNFIKGKKKKNRTRFENGMPTQQ